MLVDEGYDAGAFLTVMRTSIMAATATGPDCLEGVDDLVDAIIHQPREPQVSERIEEGELLFSQFAVHILCSLSRQAVAPPDHRWGCVYHPRDSGYYSVRPAA